MMMNPAKRATPTANGLPILTFSLGEQEYALLIEDVVEVSAMVERVAMPDALPAVIGVANRRGTPLPLLDLRIAFNQPASPITSATLFIVAAQAGEQVGLVVDDLHQVEYADSNQFNQLTTSGKYIRGIISLRSQLIPVIALPPLFEAYLTRPQQKIFEG
ncbi:MAG: chemotaxis protein CheW [Anaerolineae bacterium]|nr:chemotaxis protein CheW [Anaerolineae bacterium]